MRRSSHVVCAAYLGLGVVISTLVSGANGAGEFVPPPAVEREALATLTKQGARVQVDGEYRITTVMLGANATNDDVKLLAACERLNSLQIASPKITDVSAEHLKGLTQLKTLTISSSGMSTGKINGLKTDLPDCRISVLFGGGRGGSRDGGAPAASAPASAGPGGGGFNAPFGTGGVSSRTSRSTLARNSAVQDDLKLSPEQRQQIAAAVEANSTTAIARALDQRISAALTPEQLARLKQIELQQSSVTAVLREDIAKELKLTDDQRAAIRKQMDDASASLRTTSSELTRQRSQGASTAERFAQLREKTVEVNKSRDEKILAALSDEQRQAWQAMLGPKGPVISTSSDRSFGGFTTSTPAEWARSVFNRYDADGNGTLTDAEFPATNRTRQSLTSSGANLVFPIARDDFEKIYAKYLSERRPTAERR